MPVDTVRIHIKDEPHFARRVLLNLKEKGLEGVPNTRLKRRLGFRDVYQGYVQGISLWMAFNPVGSFGRDSHDAEIVFHADDLVDLSELSDWLRLVFGDDYDLVMKSSINRMDVFVDLHVPFTTVRDSVHQDNARRVSEWASDRNTLYLGAHPQLTRAYQKSIPINRVDYAPEPIATTNKTCLVTRIEVETHKHKLPVRTLSELSKLYDRNPFSHLEFKDVNHVILREPKARSSHALNSFRYSVGKNGFHAAKLEFNGQGNYSKTIAPYIGSIDLDLNKIWKDKLERFGIPKQQDNKHPAA